MTTSTLPVFIVTGASKGYGRAIVQELFKIGPCCVLGTARSEKELASLQSTLGSSFQYIPGDLTDVTVLQRLIQKCKELWGRIDGIVHNAGVIEPMGPISTLEVSEVKHLFDVNLFAVIELTQLALPFLRQSQGKLIFISSGAASKPYPCWSPYCMSKLALNMFTECLAKEEPEVTTIAIRPGVLDTPMQTLIREKGKSVLPSSMYDFFIQMHDKGKLVEPSRSGHIVAKLCFEAKREWSGQFVDWQDELFLDWQVKAT